MHEAAVGLALPNCIHDEAYDVHQFFARQALDVAVYQRLRADAEAGLYPVVRQSDCQHDALVEEDQVVAEDEAPDEDQAPDEEQVQMAHCKVSIKIKH
ncbi:hypothetical protein PG997_008684 [Apiospora hydei]|uniref:Uncharacterized protein n=1 Tax=Apiospora hydei TaxID=1337664 RepID=A0ABR1WBH2_9PEZI